MKKHIIPLCFLFALLVIIFPAHAQSDGPQTSLGDYFHTRFTYQGKIADAAGNPITDTCDFNFNLWDSENGASQIGNTSQVSGVVVTDGYFAALVNATNEFTSNAFVGAARWLEISVRCPGGSGDYTTLAPRQGLAVTPLASFAFTANSVPWNGITDMPTGFADGIDNNTTYTAGAGLALAANQFSVSFGGNGVATTAARSDHLHSNFWRINGNTQTDPGVNFIGTIDNAALVFKANNQTALRLEPHTTSPNVIGGVSTNAVTAGVYGATIGGGGTTSTANQVTANFGVVGGGSRNLASGLLATVCGGYFNTAGAAYAAIGGGWDNQANSDYATVSGGSSNRASDYAATVAGGGSNQASGMYAAVNGGYENIASGDYALVVGGRGNTASTTDTTVGGGQGNTASGPYATIPGGYGATATLYGQQSYASGYFATAGDAQASLYIVRNTTFNTNWGNLYLDGADDWITIPVGHTLVFDILVTGRSDAGRSAGYQIKGVIENHNGSTNLIGTPTVTVLGEDDTAWDVTVVASDAFDVLGVRVRGGYLDGDIHWVASVQTVTVASP